MRYACFAVFAPLAWSWVPAVAQQAPVSVVVSEVTQLSVYESMTLVGTVEPKRRSILSSEVEGIVREMRVDVGDFVEAGELMCQLRDDVLKMALRGAESELSRRQAQLEELEAGTRKEQIQLVKAAVDEAEAIHRKWELERERLEGLRAAGTASAKEYRDVSSEYTAALKRLAQAKFRHELAEAGPRVESIAQARYSVAAQAAVVDRFRDQVLQTSIRAPFSAYVISKRTEVGQWVDEGGPVCEVVDLDEVRIRILVPERNISHVVVGDSVRVLIKALGRTFNGTVRSIVPQAERSARTFPVEVMIPNPKHELMSGMSTRVTMRSGPEALRLVVPTDAIVYRGRTESVYVLREMPDGLIATPVTVRTGLPAGNGVAIESPGLKVGDRIVTRGNERLPGPTPVRILRTDPPVTTTERSKEPAVSGS